MSDLAGLIERVREAKGPSREIDAAIAEWAGEAPDGWSLIRQDDPKTFKMDAGKWISPDGHRIRTPKPYTASIDAALALVERLAPVKLWLILDDATNGLLNSAHREDGLKMLPISIVLALLTSLQDTTYAE